MAKSSVVLSREDLERVKAYRYSTNSLTPLEIYFFEPWWNFLANKVYPDWLAPNLITILGAVVPLAFMASVAVLCPTFTETMPQWLIALYIFAMFWFQTLDATDGKQARRTDNCSPLGQILDHNLDQLTQTCFMIGACAVLKTGANLPLILCLTPGLMAPHFSIEYRTHFTNFHQIVVGGIGQTETLVIVMCVAGFAMLHPDGNDFFDKSTAPFGIADHLSNKQIVCAFAAISGVYYNLENFFYGLKQAKDKPYALKCILPYAQFLIMMCTMSLSQFFSARAALFIFMNGNYLLYANAVLNLSTTAGMAYDWLYAEPILFVALNLLDSWKMLTAAQITMLYIAYAAWVAIRWLLLMQNIVEQICTYMGIRFLHNKPPKKHKTH